MITLTPTITKSRTNKVTIASVAEVITDRLPLFRGRTVIRIDDGDNYINISGDEYLDNIYRMITYFEQAIPEEGQLVISTLVKNRPEWDMTAFAAFFTGNILFPLDTKMNEDELLNLLSLNPPDYILTSKQQRSRINSLLSELHIEPVIIVCDLYNVFEDKDFPTAENLSDHEILISEITRKYDPEHKYLPAANLQDGNTVLCNYATSGTTSLPKIVEITHANILYQVNEAMDILNIRLNEDFLNLGPYTHIATLLEFLIAKAKGFTVTYFTREADDDKVLENEIRKLKRQGVRIRGLMAVPKFWIYIMKEVLEEMKNKPILHSLYKHLISIEKSNNFYDIGALDKAKLVSVRTFLRNKLGGYFAYGISSSTKLDPATIEIFSHLGITIIDIYGATEASGVISKNSLNESRLGSCGKLIPGMEAKLEEIEYIPGVPYPAGELYIKGRAIAKGYKGEQRLMTDKDGYYNTGDIAYLDKDNWVYIIGRKKELIKWPNGAFSDLMRLSNLLVRSVWIKDAMAIRLNENDDHLSVFIFPDISRIERDKIYRERIKNGVDHSKAMRLFFEEAIDYAQSLLGTMPRLSKEKIYMLDHKLERTPTHKIKFISELKKLNLDNFI